MFLLLYEGGGNVVHCKKKSMAVIVKNKATGTKYVLLGAGFGAFKAATGGFLGGSLFPEEDEGTFHKVAVSDFNGAIHWMNDHEFAVVEVDGIPIHELKEKYKDY